MQTAPVGGAALSSSFSRSWTTTSLATHYTLPIPTPKCLSTKVTITPFEATSLPGVQTAACSQSPAPASVVASGSAHHGYGKPKCSYTCLIAMSLMASRSKALKTAEIYKCIEQEFPYYSTLPNNNWKNSIRHSLSLGNYFRKVQNTSGLPLESGKGYFWELVPQNKAAIMSEVGKFLKREGTSNMESLSATLSAPTPYNSTGPITVIPDVKLTAKTSTGAFPAVTAIFQDLRPTENSSTCVFQDFQPIENSSTCVFQDLRPSENSSTCVFQDFQPIENSSTCVFQDFQPIENSSTCVFQDFQPIENSSTCVHPATVPQDLQPNGASSIQPATILPTADVQKAKLTVSSSTCNPSTYSATKNPNVILTRYNSSTITESATVTPQVNLSCHLNLSSTKFEPASSTAIPIAGPIITSSPQPQLASLSSNASENSPATGHKKCDELQTALNKEIEDDFLAQLIVNTSDFGTSVPIPADLSICNQDICAHNASPSQVDRDAFDRLLQELFEQDEAHQSGAGSCTQTYHDPGSTVDQMNRQNSLSQCEEELKELGLQYKTEGNFVRLLILDDFAAQSSAEIATEPPTADSSEVVLLKEGKQTWAVDKNCEESTTTVPSTEQNANISSQTLDDHDQNILTRKRSEAESDIPSKKPRLEVPLGHYSNYFNDDDLLQLTAEDIDSYINSKEFQDGSMHSQVNPVENSLLNTEPATSTAIPTASPQLQLPASSASENNPSAGLQEPDEFETALNKISVQFEDDFMEQLIANGFEFGGTKLNGHAISRPVEPSACNHADVMNRTSEDSKSEDELPENESILEHILSTERAVDCAIVNAVQLMKTSSCKLQDICAHDASPSQVDHDAYEKFLQELFDYDPMQDEAYQSGTGSYTPDPGSTDAQMNNQDNPSDCGEELTGQDVSLSSQNLDDKNVPSRKRPLELEAEGGTLSKKPRLEVPLEICSKHFNDEYMLQLTDGDIDTYIKSDAFMKSQEGLLNTIALKLKNDSSS